MFMFRAALAKIPLFQTVPAPPHSWQECIQLGIKSLVNLLIHRAQFFLMYLFFHSATAVRRVSSKVITVIVQS